MRHVPPPLAELTAHAQSLTSAGDLAGARAVLADVLDPTDADPQRATADLAVAAALHARILIALGDPHSARIWAGFAHAAEERLHGPHHERTIAAAATHAAVLQRTGNHGRAVQLYHDLVAELITLDGPDSPRVLAAQADLATAEHSAGQCTAARSRLAQVWERHRAMYGDAAPAGIKMLARLGAMQRECGHEAAGQEHVTLAQELCARYLPADHPLAVQVDALARRTGPDQHRCGRVTPSVGPGGPLPDGPEIPGVRHVPGAAPGVTPVPLAGGPGGRHARAHRALVTPPPPDPPRFVPPPADRPPTVTPPPADPPRFVPPSPGRPLVAPPPADPPRFVPPPPDRPPTVTPPPADPPSSGPAPSGPAPSDPAPSGPAPSDPAPSDPAPSGPPPSGPPPSGPLRLAPPPPEWPARVTQPAPDESPGGAGQRPAHVDQGQAYTGLGAVPAGRPAPMGWQPSLVFPPPHPEPVRTLPPPHAVVGGAAATPPGSSLVADRRLPVPVALPEPARSRRSAALVTVLLAGIAVAAVVVAATLPRGGPGEPPATADAPTTAAAAPAPTVSASPGTPASAPGGAPQDVQLRDNRDSVSLRWGYPPGSEGPVLISGGRTGQQQRAFQQLPAGTTDYVVYGLNEQANYCFTVAVIYAVDNVAAAPQTCTDRR
ncbi:tetratricopeptide repeat protein [Krasilnikovia sp. M28-CT-15]|uniref:tetratricopeptide repeat protein n=1 Tax=Krasilnikovia sp. M28-CT-15 TaxID=3373540 RepID=UPI0038769FE8